MTQYTVSVITVCLNAAGTIESALQSVCAQTYNGIEHVIIDGGSTDGTLEIIGKYRDRVSRLVSETDSGIFNAMNKGLELATGDIIFFLNADDHFHDPEVVADIVRAFNVVDSPDVIYGDLYWNWRGKQVPAHQPETVTREFLARRTILHQTVFARTSLFRRVGGFSEDLRVVSDYDWLVRAFTDSSVRWRHLDRYISVMGTGGASWNSHWERERLRVMRRYFSWYEIFLYRILPQLRQRVHRTVKNAMRK